MIGRSPGRVTALLLSRIDSPASRSGVDARQAPRGRPSERRPSSAGSLQGRRPPVSDPSHTVSSNCSPTRSPRRLLKPRSRCLTAERIAAAPAQICPTGVSHSPRCLGSTAPTGCRHRFCGEVTGDVATLEAIWVRAGYSHPSRSQEISRRDWGYCGRQPAPENSATQWRMPNCLRQARATVGSL